MISMMLAAQIAVNKTRTYSEHGHMPSESIGETVDPRDFYARILPM